MRQVPVSELRGDWALPVRERWSCSWCHAWTELGHGPAEVSRPCYEPPEWRWERAESESLPVVTSHAYGYFGATLCGIRQDGMHASPYYWLPGRADACPACREAAVVIDRRWPTDPEGAKCERLTAPEVGPSDLLCAPRPPGGSDRAA
ncbi:hypothetical protein ABT247_31280 [Kitasatospora sp. NPDC001539]|uniref:hypothetical protein n=1 Tax=Kitasatospora sp. NPDC001539 TaxID=3154384 RepID=UPI00331E6942